MADRNLDSGRNFGKGMVYLDFSFLSNGASNPVASSFRGTALGDAVLSVVYVATGKYTITLKDKFRYVVDSGADLQDIASPDGAYASLGNISGEGGGTLTCQVGTFTSGGVLTAFSGRRVCVRLVLKNSTVGV